MTRNSRIALLIAGVLLVGAGLLSLDSTWLRAHLGGVDSQLILAHAYAEGKGVEKDQARASSWYRRAADAGDARARYALAGRYDVGLGVEKNPVQATAWYARAAESGHAPAALVMARRTLDGTGADVDPVEAGKWLILAGDFALQFSDGVELRDSLKALLSPEQLEESRRLAREWRAAHAPS